ncbi:MAG: prepilin-type N-terminal cleavage/methylation domain-containing protein, partial [Gammaproteobacteria bacterium]|nr:prepilin-type N-terminal cleavage/methylation domain-containing protein [Gammaproteobacteria bacterium]
MLTRDSQLFTAFPHSRGFSLVELMVALVITLILLAGVAQIFLSSKKSYAIQNTLGRQQETGRYAFDVLATDLRRAGFWGSSLAISSGAVAASTGCLTGNTNWGRMTDHRVFGLNDAKTGYACIPDPGSTNGYSGQGDVLVVRYADPQIIGGTT